MTRRDFIMKWLMYALGALIVLFIGLYILPWFPIMGTVPSLLPVAAVTVAVLEGPIGGAGFGLFMGLISDTLIPGLPGAMTLGLTVLSLAAGVLARYGVRQNFLGCLICSAGALIIINLLRVIVYTLQERGTLPSLLVIAGPEIFWSLIFSPLIYLIFRFVYRRVPQASVL